MKKTDAIEIWTDGSCLNNPGPGGYAAIILLGNQDKAGQRVRLASGGEPHSTNNRMELMAAIAGLESIDIDSKVKLHSDSTYVINGITKWIEKWKTKDWKKIKNRDLWERLDQVAQKHTIQWIWVKGHAGNTLNEQVDKLAVAEAEMQKSKNVSKSEQKR